MIKLEADIPQSKNRKEEHVLRLEQRKIAIKQKNSIMYVPSLLSEGGEESRGKKLKESSIGKSSEALTANRSEGKG